VGDGDGDDGMADNKMWRWCEGCKTVEHDTEWGSMEMAVVYVW
jgi:hypothetical protein